MTVTYIYSGTTYTINTTNKLVKILNKAAGTYVEDAATVGYDSTNSNIGSKKLVYALSGASEYVFYIKGVWWISHYLDIIKFIIFILDIMKFNWFSF